MNSIDKLIEIIEKEKQLKVKDVINELDELSQKLKSPKDYTEDLIIELESLLIEEEKFNEEEIKFILDFAKLSDFSKDYLLTELNDKEKELLNSVSNRITNSKRMYENRVNEQINIDSLLKKLKSNKKWIITKQDIEFILEVTKEKLDFKEQILILREINKKNIEIFNNYNILENDSEEIIEEDMEITDVDSEEISALLFKYGIKYSEFSEENKILLSKFGKLEKMELILKFLQNEEVLDERLKSYTDIITRTLVYSNIEKLEELKNTDGLNFKEVVRTMPTVLYPATYSKTRRLVGGGGGTADHIKSGLLNNVLKNVDLLKANNISVNEIWNRCYSFFRQSYKANRDNIDCLKSYGISLVDENNVLREIFSVLGNRNPSIIDIYDLALEADAKEYAIKNPSSLSPSNMYKFYLIKAARKQGITDNEIFRGYQMPGREISLNKKNLILHPLLSKDIEEQFKFYGAVNVYVPNKEVYDNLFNIVAPNEISKEVLEDENIKALEKFSDSDDTYNFNGIKISKRKVLRRYTTLKNNNKAVGMPALMYCIIYNSLLDEEEFYNIYNLVKDVVSIDLDEEMRIIHEKYNDLDADNNKKEEKIIGGNIND